MNRYINNYKKSDSYLVNCVLNPVTITNLVRYIRIVTKPNLDYFFNFSKISILSRINEDRCYFSHINEMCITFSGSFRDIT